MNDEEYVPMANVINNLFNTIKVEDMSRASAVMDVWTKVLLKIKSSNPNEGRNLAEHSRIIDLSNGILLIEADHPGWIELIQLHKKFILNGIKMEQPSLKIENLAFRLKGRGGNLYGGEIPRGDRNSVRKMVEKDQENEEKLLKKQNAAGSSAQNVQKKELPPELASIFADMEKSMREKGR